VAGLAASVFDRAIDGGPVRSLELFQSIKDGLGFVLDENCRMGFWRELQFLEHMVQTPEIDAAVLAAPAEGLRGFRTRGSMTFP
jgi:hypothetical protein